MTEQNLFLRAMTALDEMIGPDVPKSVRALTAMCVGMELAMHHPEYAQAFMRIADQGVDTSSKVQGLQEFIEYAPIPFMEVGHA